jgi:hypothetical protein
MFDPLTYSLVCDPFSTRWELECVSLFQIICLKRNCGTVTLENGFKLHLMPESAEEVKTKTILKSFSMFEGIYK